MIDATTLRALGPAGLADLLGRRPDTVARPEPVSLAELADRLVQPASVLAALRRLDQPTLQVAEVLAALGGQAPRSDLDRLLGLALPTRPNGAAAGPDGTADPRQAAVDRALAALREHALLGGSAQRPCLVAAAREAWERPLGLGVPLAEAFAGRRADDLRTYARNLGLKPATRKAELADQVLTALRDPELVLRLVAAAPEPVRRLLAETARTGEPVPNPRVYLGPRGTAHRQPVEWAVARALLVDVGGWDDGLEMPAEVALTLRGPDWIAPFDPVPPHPPTRSVSPRVVASDAAAAGAAALRLVAALADEAGREPVAVLKAGGVGTRELRRLAKRTGATESEVRLGLALAHRAGLIAFDAAGLTPTGGYDDWLRGEPAQRSAALLSAWWHLPYVPTDESDGAWSPVPRWAGAVELRAAVLTAAAGLTPADQPAGAEQSPVAAVAAVAPEDLAALVLWSRPYAFDGPEPRRRAAACWVEAGLLGVAGAGALGAAGRALLDGADVAAALTGLGVTERQARFQTDLTAVVAGTPSAELTALLDAVADRESRGTASTWRFTPESVRRAFDAGRQADALLADLTAASVGGLPQPLEYLVRDVQRRHGAVRGQEVACCLRADDTALLAQIAADRRLRGLGLRVLAPTVLAGAKPLAETLAGLREAGYAPVAEQADGTPVLEQVRPHRADSPARGARRTAGRRATSREPVGRETAGRETAGRETAGREAAGRETAGRQVAAPAGRPPTPTEPPVPQPAELAELARALLAKPDSVAPPASASLPVVREAARQLSDGPARILAHAIDTGSPVRIDYVNQAGNVTRRVIEDIDLSGTVILAWCRLREDERMFNLGRILAVTPAGS